VAATLKNNSKQAVVLVLDHPAFANKESGWSRGVGRFAASTEEGHRVVSEVRRSYAGSLTILPGESVEGLHEAIEHCSQVPALRAAKVLTLTIQPDGEQPPPLKSALVERQPLGDVEIQKADSKKKG
jgi:hypothetical protein